MSNSEDSNEIENKFKIFSSQKMKTNRGLSDKKKLLVYKMDCYCFDSTLYFDD